MTNLGQTPLEAELLRLFHERHRDKGFPPPKDIEVTRRENTGFGRFVGLKADVWIKSENRTLFIEKYDVLIPTLLNDHLFAVIFLEDHKMSMLELSTNGEVWDGNEEGYSIVFVPDGQ